MRHPNDDARDAHATFADLARLQRLVRQMYIDRGFASSSAPTLALGVCEEAGEVARAILITECKDFTPSPKKLSPEWADARNVGEEVGDLITYCLALCNALGIEPRFKWLERGWTWSAHHERKTDATS